MCIITLYESGLLKAISYHLIIIIYHLIYYLLMALASCG